MSISPIGVSMCGSYIVWHWNDASDRPYRGYKPWPEVIIKLQDGREVFFESGGAGIGQEGFTITMNPALPIDVDSIVEIVIDGVSIPLP